MREQVINWIKETYQCTEDYPWERYPDFSVFRHIENEKWFALFMTIPKEKLGIHEEGYINLLNIKVEPFLNDSLIEQPGFYPPYHQRGGSWVSVALDGRVDVKEIQYLVEMSYNLTLPKNKIINPDYRNTKWIVPANPKYYDLDKAIQESGDGTFIWKQSNRILVGDIVYIYVASPVSSIRYQCEAIEVNIPYPYKDKNVKMSHVMKLKVLKEYPKHKISFEVLKQYGVKAIRGPRSMPKQLEEAIDHE